jgi:hypothetical protein
MRKRAAIVLFACLMLLGACSSEPSGQSGDAGNDIGQTTSDANHGAPDASDTADTADSSTPDAGQPDAGQPDADAEIEPDACDDGCAAEEAAGLFLSPALLERARQRASGAEEPFASAYSIQEGRADSALDLEADPFVMQDITEITFGWCGGGEETLSEATSRIEEQSDRIRTLALQFALTGDEQYADKSLALMLAWAEVHTPVNLYDFNPDFSSAEIDGQTDGFCSDRPWNFALDAMWQTYGLINTSDAYLLLTRNGYDLDTADDDQVREWLLTQAEAVNSSFHAWTKWADNHTNAGSYERYRSDNHLSWSLAGLIAAAAALEDEDLAAYVLSGGTWNDRRAGDYENPSHIRDVIARAIEGDADGERGRLYEEKITRDPPVGYSFFHLWAIAIVAQVADLHFDDDIWTHAGPDGGSIEDAYDRYTAFVLGERDSPKPDQDGDMTGLSWHYEVALHQWDKSRYRQAVEQIDRNRYIVQSWGPLVLLFGE